MRGGCAAHRQRRFQSEGRRPRASGGGSGGGGGGSPLSIQVPSVLGCLRQSALSSIGAGRCGVLDQGSPSLRCIRMACPRASHGRFSWDLGLHGQWSRVHLRGRVLKSEGVRGPGEGACGRGAHFRASLASAARRRYASTFGSSIAAYLTDTVAVPERMRPVTLRRPSAPMSRRAARRHVPYCTFIYKPCRACCEYSSVGRKRSQPKTIRLHALRKALAKIRTRGQPMELAPERNVRHCAGTRVSV